jgi:hypothetical protein
MSLLNQHAKNASQYYASMLGKSFITGQVKVALHTKHKQYFVQFVIVCHLLKHEWSIINYESLKSLFYFIQVLLFHHH